MSYILSLLFVLTQDPYPDLPLNPKKRIVEKEFYAR